MSNAVPVFIEQEVGESIWFGGSLVTFKVTSEQAGGVLCMAEHALKSGQDRLHCIFTPIITRQPM